MNLKRPFNAKFLLVGEDYEHDERHHWFWEKERAIVAGEAMLAPSSEGPAWLSYSVWGNHETTGNWECLQSK